MFNGKMLKTAIVSSFITIASLVTIGNIANHKQTSEPVSAQAPVTQAKIETKATPTVTPEIKPQLKLLRQEITKAFESKIYKIGDRIETSGRAITTGTPLAYNGFHPQNSFASPIEGIIVAVPILAENASSESGDMMFSRFTLQDAQGRTYEELDGMSYAMWRSEHGYKRRSEQMYPGEQRQDLVAFRVAPNASGFTMSWKGNTVNLMQQAQQQTSQIAQEAQYNTSSTVERYPVVAAGDGYANLRTQPSTEVAILDKVSNGTQISEILDTKINSDGQKWYKVSVNNKTGWLFAGVVKVGDDSKD